MFFSFDMLFSFFQTHVNTHTLTFIMISVICLYHFRRRKLYKCASKLPSPPHWPIIGAADIFRSKIADLIHNYHLLFRNQGARLCHCFAGPYFLIFCMDASPVYFTLTKFLRKSIFYQVTYKLFRNGVLGFSHIEEWKTARKQISPSFHHSVIKSYVTIFFEESNILVNKLRQVADEKESFYPETILNLATFDMVIRSTLGVDPKAQENDDHPVVQAMMEILQSIQARIFKPWLWNNLICNILGYKQTEERYEKIIRDYTRDILRNMEKDENSSSISFAKHMMKSDINEDDLITHIINVIFAGTDTTKTANFAVLLMLALHPDVQEKAYGEVIAIMGTDPQKQPSYEDLLNMSYLEMIIKEGMRLFPPVPIVGRQVITDEDKFEDLEIPNGTTIVVDIYAIHRDSTYYENPNKFDPDRFLPDEIKKRPIGSFIPFLVGPRDCIGRKYAMLQMKTVVSTILRHYKIIPSPSCVSMEDIQLDMIVTSKFSDNCQIQLETRELK